MSAVAMWYKNLMRSDPRTINWFLISDFAPLSMILTSYIIFCTSIGPRFMKDKKPFSLRKILILYNFIQILFSIYLLHEGLMSGWLRDYSYKCQPVDYSDNPKALRMAKATHMYFISKLTELLDTVFFVFRKKNHQISTLHLYHHTIMPFAAWFCTKYVPGGHPTLIGTVNVFVHIVMYSYYLLSSLGHDAKKFIWWKKYVTLIQMLQFCIVFVHAGQTFLTDCDFPKVLNFLIMVNAIVFIYMFGSFYVANYTGEKNERTLQTVGNGTSERKLD